MTAYRVEYSKAALKCLKKLDNGVARAIYAWASKNLEGTDDPRIRGLALSANRSGQWRYRVGDYRLLCLIEDYRLIILVVTIGHRRNVYDR